MAAPRAEEEALCGGGCGLQEQLRGASAAPWRGAYPTGSENSTAQVPENRGPGHSPGFGLPRDRQRPGEPRTARMLLPRAEQISTPAPEPPGPADGLLQSYCGG